MIYIFTALYPEAKVVIRHWNMKRKQSGIRFDVFEAEGIRLILTGVGSLAAATAVGSSLAYFHAGEKDFLINWGSCASREKIGSVFLCHRLIDSNSGYTFYPDLLFASELPEASAVTGNHVWSRGQMDEMSGKDAGEIFLYDMEAAAVYFSAAYTFSPHQMHFIKVVTDHGEGKISAEELAERMESGFLSLHSYLRLLREYEKQEEEEAKRYQEEEGIWKSICREFCCSAAMEQSFRQHVKYWSLAGVDYQAELQRMREAGMLPCRNRREGKGRLEQLKSELNAG